MSDLDTFTITLTNFTVLPSRDGRTIQMVFSGSADLEAREHVEALLVRTHEEALRSDANRVIVDVRRLEFMNSSCLKSFVTWLGRALELPRDAQYKIIFRTDPAHLWQRRSLHALQSLAADLVSIEA